MQAEEKRLLEMAAKAAGIAIVPCSCSNPRWPFKHDEANSGEHGHWNPLVNDGDALRLAVTLGMALKSTQGKSTAIVAVAHVVAIQDHGCDPFAATRRAIVRAAAAIGEEMP